MLIRVRGATPGKGLVNEVIVVQEKEAGQLRMLVATCLALHVQVQCIHHSGQVVAERLPPVCV